MIAHVCMWRLLTSEIVCRMPANESADCGIECWLYAHFDMRWKWLCKTLSPRVLQYHTQNFSCSTGTPNCGHSRPLKSLSCCIRVLLVDVRRCYGGKLVVRESHGVVLHAGGLRLVYLRLIYMCQSVCCMCVWAENVVLCFMGSEKVLSWPCQFVLTSPLLDGTV